MSFCHASGLAFMGVNRNQESVAVGIRELVALSISVVLDGSVELESAIVLRAKVFHVLQDDSVPVGSGLSFQFHFRQLAIAELSFYDISSAGDLDGSFLHFQFAPLEAVGLENHGRERFALLFRGGWIKRHYYPLAFLVCTPLIAQVTGKPVFRSSQVSAAGLPFPDFHRHVELAMGVFSMLVEIALAEQMATAGFDIVGLHTPFWFCRG